MATIRLTGHLTLKMSASEPDDADAGRSRPQRSPAVQPLPSARPASPTARAGRASTSGLNSNILNDDVFVALVREPAGRQRRHASPCGTMLNLRARRDRDGAASGSYGVGFVKPFFQHLVVSPRWKEGAEGWTCWSSLSEREAKRGYDPIQGWSHSYRPNWPASSYPAEREALNHHALVRQGRGPRRQVQIFATALKPEPGAAHCHLGAVRKRRWVASSSSRLFWRFVHHCRRSRRGSSFSAP